MKREHSAYFEYFTEPPARGSTDWTWRVLVHRIPAVTRDITVACQGCDATGIARGKTEPCGTCKGAKQVVNKVSVPDELKGKAKDLVSARAAAQDAGKKAVEKHRIREDGSVAPIQEGQ